MKLSDEAKVAAAVATGFAALTVGVIAHGNSGAQRTDPYEFGPKYDLGVRTHMSRHGYNSSLADRTNAREDGNGTQWQLQE